MENWTYGENYELSAIKRIKNAKARFDIARQNGNIDEMNKQADLMLDAYDGDFGEPESFKNAALQYGDGLDYEQAQIIIDEERKRQREQIEQRDRDVR